jgi:hypothetical protein
MFSGKPDAKSLAAAAAHYFSNDVPVHSLGIDREAAKAKQLEITDLESSDALQDAVLSVHHATIHTLGMSPAVKIVENHLGRTYVKMEQKQAQISLPIIIPQPPPQGPPQQPLPRQGPPPGRPPQGPPPPTPHDP